MPEDFSADPIDTRTPSAARMYDLYLGGTRHYEVDRQFASQIYEVCPIVDRLAQANRAFLGRAVRFGVNQGLNQFIDVGSGIPTVGNVHEIVHETNPDATVIYCDNDMDAVGASLELLDQVPNATCIEGDLRIPKTVLDNDELQARIDFATPIMLIFNAVLHFVNDKANPYAVVREYLDRLPSGSLFAVSHVGVDEAEPEAARQVLALEAKYGSTQNPATLRTRAQVTAFFDGLELVEPGVTYVPDWRPSSEVDVHDLARKCLYGGVARKP